MDLPKGPDTLCFDKDEFMKVRAGARRPGAGQGRLRSASCRVPSAGTSLRFAASLASGVAGAARRERCRGIVHIESKGPKVLAEWF